MTDRRIREAIDACRPGADDLGLPEMEELAELVDRGGEVKEHYDRTQRLDAAIRDAFCDVAAPSGLSVRLLAAVAAQGAAQPPLDDQTVSLEPHRPGEAGDGDVEPSGGGGRPARVSRRAVWIGSLAAAAALLALAASIIWLRPKAPIDRGWIAEAANRWVGQLAQDERPWRADLGAGQLEGYPLPPVLKGSPSAWRPFRPVLTDDSRTIALDRQAVVYDLRRRLGQRRAILFVIRSPAGVEAPQAPPRRPTRVTGGWSIGVWREGRLLYVLAVEGDQGRYRSYIKPPPSLA